MTVPANSSAVDLLLAALSSIAFFAAASLSSLVCPIIGLGPRAPLGVPVAKFIVLSVGRPNSN